MSERAPIPPELLDAVTCGEALGMTQSLPDSCVDAIVTDPPYSSTGDAASIMRSADGALVVPLETQFYEAWLREHLTEWKRVLKPGGAAWFTIDWRGAMVTDSACRKLGLHPPTVGVWYRRGMGMGHMLRRVYECFVVIPMPRFERMRADEIDVWDHKWTPGNRQNGHSAEKPIPLMQRACRLVAPPGGVVLDPFAGSGTTCIAARNEGFHFVAFERESEYAEIARRRLATQPVATQLALAVGAEVAP